MLLPTLAGGVGAATFPVPCHHLHPCQQHRTRVAETSASRAPAIVEETPLQTQPAAGTRGLSPVLNQEFKYTAIALKTSSSSSGGSRLGLRRRKLTPWRSQARGTGHAKKAVNQEEALKGWRTFETLEGCALPLMMLGEVDEAQLPAAERVANLSAPLPLVAVPAAGSTHEQPQQPLQSMQTQAAMPAQLAAQVQQPQQLRRTHRRVNHAGKHGHAAADQAATLRPSHSLLGPTIVLHPPQDVSAAHQALRQSVTNPSPQQLADSSGTLQLPARSTEHNQHIDSMVETGSSSISRSSSATGSIGDWATHAAPVQSVFDTPQQVDKHLHACAKALGMPRGQLERHKWLVTTLLRLQDHHSLRQHMKQLSSCLRLPKKQVQNIVSLHPPLLLHPIEAIQVRAQQVAALMQGPEASIASVSPWLSQFPKLLTIQHTPQQAMVGLCHCLAPALGMQGVVQVVYRCPAVLAHPDAPTGQPFNTMISLLAEQLGCSQQEVIQTWIAGLPEVLLRSPAAVRGACHAFAVQWGLDAEQDHMAELMVAQPTLLLLTEGSAKVLSFRVKKPLRRSRHWAKDLARLRLKPRALARALSFDTSRYDRLDYLVSTLRDGGLDWREALTMPDEDWHDMYPSYREWWAQQGR